MGMLSSGSGTDCVVLGVEIPHFARRWALMEMMRVRTAASVRVWRATPETRG